MKQKYLKPPECNVFFRKCIQHQHFYWKLSHRKSPSKQMQKRFLFTESNRFIVCTISTTREAVLKLSSTFNKAEHKLQIISWKDGDKLFSLLFWESQSIKLALEWKKLELDPESKDNDFRRVTGLVDLLVQTNKTNDFGHSVSKSWTFGRKERIIKSAINGFLIRRPLTFTISPRVEGLKNYPLSQFRRGAIGQ